MKGGEYSRKCFTSRSDFVAGVFFFSATKNLLVLVHFNPLLLFLLLHNYTTTTTAAAAAATTASTALATAPLISPEPVYQPLDVEGVARA